MKRNELFTSTAVANEDTSLISMVQENISEENRNLILVFQYRLNAFLIFVKL